MCVLLTGVSGAWAGKMSWTSGYAQNDVSNYDRVGFTVPADVTTGSYCISFDLYMRSGGSGVNIPRSTYLCISSSSTLSAGSVLGISNNKSNAVIANGYVTFNFVTPVALTSEGTYHLFFLTDKDDITSTVSNRIGVKDVGEGNWPAGLYSSFSGKTFTQYAPDFKVTLYNDESASFPLRYSTGGKFNQASTYASAWTFNPNATQLTLSTVANRIRVSDGALFTGAGSGVSGDSEYTITATNGYKITGYKIEGTPVTSSKNQTITPATGEGSAVVFTSSGNTLTVSGISKSSTTFTLTGENTGLSISSMEVYVTYDSDVATMVTTLKNNMSTYKAMTGVGYPKSDAAERTALNSAYAVINGYNGSTWNYTKAGNYADQLQAFNNYLACTDIEMPVDGKVYSFINVQADETTMFYLNNTTVTDISTLRPVAYTEGTTVIPESGQFVCHKVADNQFVFVSKAGQYMQGASNGSKDSPAAAALSDTYNSDRQVVTITKFPGTSGGYVVLPSSGAKFSFGKVWMKTTKGATRDDVTNFIILGSSSRFDAATGAYLYNGYSSAYYLKEAGDYYNKVTLTSDGADAYASLYLPFAVTIPSGITAYAVASQNGDYAHMESIVSNGTLPKNTPAILKKAGQDEKETIYLSPAIEAGSAYGETNLLGGTVDDKTRASLLEELGTGSIYVLANGGEGLGLYNYTGTNLAKGKAYLFVAGVGTKALAFSFGDETAVKSLNDAKQSIDNAEIYNIAGQRMSRVQKGVNIVNGKKVLVK